MTIPATCENWRAHMAAGTHGEAAILDNLLADMCLPADVEDAFFAQLSTAGTPAGCCEARIFSKKVVIDSPHFFLCRGPVIPAATFQTVVRLRKAKDFYYCLPETRRIAFAAFLGIPESDLRDGDQDDLEIWLAAYAHELATGGFPPVAFVTDDSTFPTAAALAGLVDRLGLPNWTGETLGLLFRYPRAHIPGELHIPRSLDGIDFAEFSLVADCASPHGITRPHTAAIAGLPEAVHPGCEIPHGLYSFNILI